MSNIRECVECRHSGMREMQTFEYAWNADVRVYVECRQLGMRGLQVSGGVEVPSAV